MSRRRRARSAGLFDVTNREGLTWREWFAAANPTSTSVVDLRRAWERGEDPTEYRARGRVGGAKRGRSGGKDDSVSDRARREAARIAEFIWTHRQKNGLPPRLTEAQIRNVARLVGSDGVVGMTDLVVREYKMRLSRLN